MKTILPLRLFLLLLLAGGLAACGGLGGRLANSLSQAVLNNDDPAMVEAGLPAYLITLDALVRDDPDNGDIKLAAAELNSAYASAFVHDEAHARLLTDKSMTYALAALCAGRKSLCNARQMDIDSFRAELGKLGKDDVPLIYGVGSSWAGWIQARSSDFNAVAELPRVRALMERVVALNEGYQDGAADLYLGVLSTLLTPALGGHPEEGKVYFEKALGLSQGHNLLVKVYYAKNYARSVFNRELHDRLLNEVLAADPHAEGWTLSNVLAQQQAKDLLKSADDYF
jgi:hypothetical protein